MSEEKTNADWRRCIAELEEVFLLENTGDANSTIFNNTVEFMKKEPEFMMSIIEAGLEQHQRAARIIVNS